MTPETRLARAIAVKALLDDPNVKDAFAEIEADLFTEWRNCHDAQERENLWRAMNIIDRLKGWMASAASHEMVAMRRAGQGKNI